MAEQRAGSVSAYTPQHEERLWALLVLRPPEKPQDRYDPDNAILGLRVIPKAACGHDWYGEGCPDEEKAP